jgi:hypothetical protein
LQHQFPKLFGFLPVQDQNPQPEQFAEKIGDWAVFAAQPSLAVRFLHDFAKAHSQEWLCYLDGLRSVELAHGEHFFLAQNATMAP